MLKLSIIIINYKTFQLTCNCIDSILRYCALTEYEIILVENGTGEFNGDNISHWGEKVKLIVSENNLGFAGGNNLGIRIAKGKYVLLLNSDTYFVDDAISPVLQYLEQNSNVGVVSAQLIYPDGRQQSAAQRFPNIKYKLIELFRLQKLLSKKAAGRILLGSFFDHTETVKVDWVWGAYFMFPKNILAQLPRHQLDETYFMYFEDMQWCMDISSLGYEIHYFADARVIHLLGGSSGRKNEMMEKNGALFMCRNYPPFQRWLIKFISRLL
jgi:GT2 family glycosyltransferase